MANQNHDPHFLCTDSHFTLLVHIHIFFSANELDFFESILFQCKVTKAEKFASADVKDPSPLYFFLVLKI